MHPHQFQELLKKFSEGSCTRQEEEFIIDWYNRIGEPGDLPLGEEEKLRTQESLWAAIDPIPVNRRKWLPLLKRAAVITLPILVCMVIYLQRQSISPFIKSTGNQQAVSKEINSRVYNSGIQVREITLVDGSRVVLQPASEITYKSDFSGATREVRLKGEAFFKVKRNPDKPFIVYSNEVTTRVLGTSFTIRAYENDGEITVAVKTGKVSVFANNKHTSDKNKDNHAREIILTPNQQMVYHRGREVASKKLVEKPEIIVPDSKLFRMQFDNADVSEIFEVLAENYGVKIRYDKDLLSNCKLTTSMSDEGLYERIQIICKAIGASYSIDEDAEITIKSKGC